MSCLFPRIAFAPVRCVAPIRHEISPLWSLFDDATRQLQQFERQTRRSQFNPRFDLKEDKEAYFLEGEVPGFKDNELSIEWNDNVLAIRGKHESVTESGNKPQAVEAQSEKAAIEDNAATSETNSVKSQKSHQPTVEDEEPANASAVAAEVSEAAPAPKPTEQAVAKTEAAQKPEVQHWISERRSGRFLRQFSFPANAISHEAIKASLESGILKIVVPKAPTPESRRINIE